ncbi:MAG: hypothetical protein K2W95_31580 [Candidatus Obscuribacterales bacterium]|nr:hypothetical protein [Candidatus Obscuribacterales bacterium]
MLVPVIFTMLFGAILGGVWGLSSGLMRKNDILASQDPGTQLMRNALGGIAGYFVATLIVGAAPFNFIGVMFGIVVSIIVENWFMQR